MSLIDTPVAPDRPAVGLAVGLTPRQVAARLRVSADKIRLWIQRGELQAVNVARVLCGRPQWVILPEHLVAFEQGRSATPPPTPKRRRKRIGHIDFYPD